MESLNESDFLYFKQAMDGVATANSVLAFVQSILVQKYGLKDGDQIQPDGLIVRVGSYAGRPAEEAVDKAESVS